MLIFQCRVRNQDYILFLKCKKIFNFVMKCEQQ